MLGAAIASMIESIGDHYTCARVCGAPIPTPKILSRAIVAEGIGVVLDGLLGKGLGSTSSSGDVAVIAITKVASRAVIQLAAIILMVIGTLGKVTAALASLPQGIVGGMLSVVLGSLIAVGLSNVKLLSRPPRQDGNLFVDRNLFIIGFALFNCLSIAGPGGYFSRMDDHYEKNNPFGSTEVGHIALTICSSPMLIALTIALVLDNTIPGSSEERGLPATMVINDVDAPDIHNDPDYMACYSLPQILLSMAQLFHNGWHYVLDVLSHHPTPPPTSPRGRRG